MPDRQQSGRRNARKRKKSQPNLSENGRFEYRMSEKAPVPICPRCNSDLTRRSHYQNFVEDMRCRLKGVEPHRCINCDLRFMVRLEKQVPAK
jgi:hypothetical protein